MKIEEIYGQLPSLETKRLLLRKLTLEDTSDMHDFTSDSIVSKYVSWDPHTSLADTKSYLHYVIKQYENRQIAPWGLEYKENGKLIGTIDFVYWDPKNQTAEIGYAISRQYWGAGITTEAAAAVLSFGFDQMDLIRIQARCLSQNIASQRVMEKCGMTYEGTIRKGLLVKGVHRDLKLYSILSEEHIAKQKETPKYIYDPLKLNH